MGSVILHGFARDYICVIYELSVTPPKDVEFPALLIQHEYDIQKGHNKIESGSVEVHLPTYAWISRKIEAWLYDTGFMDAPFDKVLLMAIFINSFGDRAKSLL